MIWIKQKVAQNSILITINLAFTKLKTNCFWINLDVSFLFSQTAGHISILFINFFRKKFANTSQKLIAEK